MVGLVKRAPGNEGNCCLGECGIYSTTFPTAALLASQWTSNHGTYPQYNAGTGDVDIAAADVRAIANTAHPTSPYNPVVRAVGKGPANSELRVYLSWTGTSGLVAEFRPGAECGTLELIEVQSGSETSITSASIPNGVVNVEHEIQACYDDDNGVFYGHVKVIAEAAVYRITGSPASHTASTGAGFGTGGGHTGTATFSRFDFWDLGRPSAYVSEPCEECPPDGCAWAVGHFDATGYYSCEWDDDGGTWTIDAANEWLETTETSSWILHQATNWRDTTETRLKLRFYCDSDDRVIRAIFSALDEDNYNCIEIKVGTGTDNNCAEIKIIERSGGVDSTISTQVVQDVPSGAWYWLSLEMVSGPGNGYTLRAVLADTENQDISSTLRVAIESYPGFMTYFGDQVGFATAGGSGEVRLSSFVAGCTTFLQYCELEVDDFTNWPSSGVQCNWTTISGTNMSQSGFTAACMMENQNPPTGIGLDQHAAEIDFTPSTQGDKIGVTAGGDDDSYYLAEIEAGPTSPKFRLIKCTAGSKATLQTFADPIVAPLSQQGTLRICVQPGGTIVANYTDYLGNTVALYDNNETPFGGYCGIDATPAGSVVVANEFRTYRVGSINAAYPAETQECDFCELPCTACIDNTPSAWIVSTSTVEDGNCDCSILNGSFYVDEPSSGFSITCQMQAEYSLGAREDCYNCTYPISSTSYTYGLTGNVIWTVTPIFNPVGNNRVKVTLEFDVKAEETADPTKWDEWRVLWTFYGELGASGGTEIDCKNLADISCYLDGHATAVSRSVGPNPGTGVSPATVFDCKTPSTLVHVLCGYKGDLISGNDYYLDTDAVVSVSAA